MSKQPLAARLYFFYMLKCPHCALAEPDVTKFQRKHPQLMALRINLQKREEVGDFAPAGTPAYLLKLNEKQAFTHVGRLTLAELEAAYEEALAEFEDAQELGLGEEEEAGDEAEEEDGAAKDEEE